MLARRGREGPPAATRCSTRLLLSAEERAATGAPTPDLSEGLEEGLPIPARWGERRDKALVVVAVVPVRPTLAVAAEVLRPQVRLSEGGATRQGSVVPVVLPLLRAPRLQEPGVVAAASIKGTPAARVARAAEAAGAAAQVRMALTNLAAEAAEAGRYQRRKAATAVQASSSSATRFSSLPSVTLTTKEVRDERPSNT